MNDWGIGHREDDSTATVDHDWEKIDALIAKLVELQARDCKPSKALESCIAELEHAISLALSHGVSVRAIGVRTNLSQSDVARIRDTGRLYER